jgi:subtilisin family serine protease
MRYSSVVPFNVTSRPIQMLGFGKGESHTNGCLDSDYLAAANYLTKYQKSPPDFIIAVSSGGCIGHYKSELADLYGYKYILTYDTSPQEYAVSDPEEFDPATQIKVGFEDSQIILAGYKKHPLGYNISLSDKTYVAESPTAIGGGLMSNYSSFGPTADFRLKPQLSAPGGDILSTWPLESNGYAIISGTSMSTPYIAGCYALIKSQRPELIVGEIYALMMNTGKPVPWLYDQSILSSATHQGAGLVNAYDALMSETLILPPQLNLRNDNFTVKANITISNRSNGTKTYALGHKVSHPS